MMKAATRRRPNGFSVIGPFDRASYFPGIVEAADGPALTPSGVDRLSSLWDSRDVFARNRAKRGRG